MVSLSAGSMMVSAPRSCLSHVCSFDGLNDLTDNARLGRINRRDDLLFLHLFFSSLRPVFKDA